MYFFDESHEFRGLLQFYLVILIVTHAIMTWNTSIIDINQYDKQPIHRNNKTVHVLFLLKQPRNIPSIENSKLALLPQLISPLFLRPFPLMQLHLRESSVQICL
jgi:hypothetical protein